MLVAEKQQMTSDPKARLVDLIKRKSFIQGPEIRLASGRTSTFYFNMKPTAFDPEGAALIAQLILEKLYERKADYVGGLEMGAVPIVAVVSHASFAGRWPIPGFFVRKQAKEHGTGQLIEGIADIAELRGKRAVLIDDVTTTGGSVLKAVEAARESGCTADTVITVVDRLEGAEENLARHGVELIALATARDFGI